MSVFKLLKEVSRLNLWKRKIPRQNFEPTSSSVVCEQHFEDKFIVRCSKDGAKGRPKLTPDSYPTIFQSVPAYLSEKTVSARTTNPEARSQKVDSMYEHQFNHDLQSLIDDHNITCIEDVKKFTNVKSNIPFRWFIMDIENCIYLGMLDLNIKPTQIKAHIYINSDCTYVAHLNGFELPRKKLANLGCANVVISTWFDVQHLMVVLKNLFDNKDDALLFDTILSSLQSYIDSLMESESSDMYNRVNCLVFLLEQLKLLNLKPNCYTYSSDTTIFAYTLLLKSTAAYNFIRESNLLQIPHPRTLRKMSKLILDNGNFESHHKQYLKQKTNLLNEEEKLVCVLVDEIHIKPSLRYKKGNVVGSSVNNSKSLANSVHTIMLTSLMSKNKDVVSFLPVRKISNEELYAHIKQCVINLESVGYIVVSIITDNNSINRKVFERFLVGSQFPSPVACHPCDPLRPLFLIFDTVHILKCIRNNWLAQKGIFRVPNLEESVSGLKTAKFQNLVDLHNLEKNSLTKYAYKLSSTILFPSNLQKQKVSYVTNVFDRSNVAALQLLGPKHSILKDWEGTADFLSNIINWWEIVNVKSCMKGIRKRNVNMNPIFSMEDLQVKFLLNFNNWLNRWKAANVGQPRCGLSKETFNSLSHTVTAFIRLIRYLLIDCKFKYVLLGKFQTDQLEARFGQYRQLSGCNYNISLEQIYESERKIKIVNFLKIKSFRYGDVAIKDLCSYFECPDIDVDNVDDDLIKACLCKNIDLTISENDLNNIAFIVGYACFKIKNLIQCSNCINAISTEKSIVTESQIQMYKLIELCDRNGLTDPSIPAVVAGVHCFAVFSLLISDEFEDRYLRSKTQLQIIVNTVMNFLGNDESLISESVHSCYCGNNLMELLKKIVVKCCNVLIKNYVNNLTNNSIESKLQNSRKLNTLTQYI